TSSCIATRVIVAGSCAWSPIALAAQSSARPRPLSLAEGSKLGCNRRLVDDRPHFPNPRDGKLVEHVFCKHDALSVDGQAEQHAMGRAVETQTACDPRRLGYKEFDLEAKIR